MMAAASAEPVETGGRRNIELWRAIDEHIVGVGEEMVQGKCENAALLYRKRKARHDEPSVR